MPYIYDSNGEPKQQKICKKDLKDLLKSEPDFEKVVSTVKNEGQAQKITAQTRSSQADVDAELLNVSIRCIRLFTL